MQLLRLGDFMQLGVHCVGDCTHEKELCDRIHECNDAGLQALDGFGQLGILADEGRCDLVIGIEFHLRSLPLAIGKDAGGTIRIGSPRLEVQALIATEPRRPRAGSDADQGRSAKGRIDAQKTRTPARIAEAKQDDGYSVTLFTHLEGPGLTAANDPITFRFFERASTRRSARWSATPRNIGTCCGLISGIRT